MPSVAETLTTGTALNASLRDGLETIDQNQTIVFTKYARVVLPLDGFVFWVRAAILSPSALLGTSLLDTAQLDVGATETPTAANTLTAQGSLHQTSRSAQDEESSYTTNQVVFTSEGEIKDFQAIAPGQMWVGTFGGVRFSFSEQRPFYQQAGLYHYLGVAITAIVESQIVDSPQDLDTRSLIVSNSLPIWLAMNQMQPIYPYRAAQNLPLYPSYLVPPNVPLPYGSVHVVPGSTEAIGSTPYIDQMNNHWQLTEEEVEITIFGYRNYNVMDFLDYVIYQSLATDVFGIMNCPVPHDDKSPQVDLQVIAMKKRITFKINYYQQRARQIAKQVIEAAIPNYIIPAL